VPISAVSEKTTISFHFGLPSFSCAWSLCVSALSCGLISATNAGFWAGFGISTNSGESVSREEKVAIVEAYLRGLADKDISKVAFAANIAFEGPRVGKLIGRNAVIGFLTSILPAVKRVQIKQHIVEGNFVATVFEMETIFGVDQVFDCVHVCDGELKEIHSFYYPQPNQTTRVS
jgi:SnoaL-like domain